MRSKARASTVPAQRFHHAPGAREGPDNAAESITDRPADIRIDTTLVLIPVAVTDPMSRFVTGLDKENFKLYEDKMEQEISQFSSEDAPLSVGIVFDTSGSMGAKLQKSRQAVTQFMKTANPQDEFFWLNSATGRSWCGVHERDREIRIG